MAIIRIKNLGICEIPIIDTVGLNGSDEFVITYTVTPGNLGSVDYQIATDSGFTNIVKDVTGYTGSSPITVPSFTPLNYNNLYVRFRKQCVGAETGTVQSGWSGVKTWTKSAIRIINVNHGTLADGRTTYDVEVTGGTFVGYVNAFVTNNSTNTRNVKCDVGLSRRLIISAYSPAQTEDSLSEPVSIPVGVYPKSIQFIPEAVPHQEEQDFIASLYYSLTAFGVQIAGAYVEDAYVVEAVGRGGVE